MSENTEKKQGFWYTPLPVSLLAPFKFIYRKLLGNKEIPPTPDKVLRTILICLGIASLPVIWILEGFGNPLELLVDIPFFSLIEYPSEYNTYYFVFITFFSMIFLYILQYGICRGKEYPFFSVNGILIWVISLTLGIVSDSFTRNIFLEKYFIPLYENTHHATIDNYKDKLIFLLLLIVTLLAFYYALSDSMSTSLSIFLTPYAMAAYNAWVPATGILQHTLIKYLIITLVLKLILTLADKIGLIEVLTKFIGKYFYTPRYYLVTCLVIFLLPFWPILLIVYLVRHSGKKKTQV